MRVLVAVLVSLLAPARLNALLKDIDIFALELEGLCHPDSPGRFPPVHSSSGNIKTPHSLSSIDISSPLALPGEDALWARLEHNGHEPFTSLQNEEWWKRLGGEPDTPPCTVLAPKIADAASTSGGPDRHLGPSEFGEAPENEASQNKIIYPQVSQEWRREVGYQHPSRKSSQPTQVEFGPIIAQGDEHSRPAKIRGRLGAKALPCNEELAQPHNEDWWYQLQAFSPSPIIRTQSPGTELTSAVHNWHHARSQSGVQYAPLLSEENISHNHRPITKPLTTPPHVRTEITSHAGRKRTHSRIKDTTMYPKQTGTGRGRYLGEATKRILKIARAEGVPKDDKEKVFAEVRLSPQAVLPLPGSLENSLVEFILPQITPAEYATPHKALVTLLRNFQSYSFVRPKVLGWATLQRHRRPEILGFQIQTARQEMEHFEVTEMIGFFFATLKGEQHDSAPNFVGSGLAEDVTFLFLHRIHLLWELAGKLLMNQLLVPTDYLSQEFRKLAVVWHTAYPSKEGSDAVSKLLNHMGCQSDDGLGSYWAQISGSARKNQVSATETIYSLSRDLLLKWYSSFILEERGMGNFIHHTIIEEVMLDPHESAFQSMLEFFEDYTITRISALK